jgi:hypothetical protein
MDTSEIPEQQNAAKTRRLAAALFPGEEWVKTEPNIYVAKSRLHEQRYEIAKWNKEMSQVRILTRQGSIAYFLPEQKTKARLYVDSVIDGKIVELKTVTGNRSTLGSDFRQGYKQGAAILSGRSDIQGHSVFIRLLSILSVGSVKAKIAGELKERLDPGTFMCFFEHSGEYHSWSYDELRALIGRA